MIGVGGVNLNNPFNTGIVSGAELQQVSKEIFAAASKLAPAAQSVNIPQVKNTNNGVNLFTADIQTANQVAKARAGVDIQISSTAMNNIQALNAAAAKAQTVNVDKVVEGKIFVPSSNSETVSLKDVFSLSNAAQLFNTSNLGKDKKGSSSSIFLGGQKHESTKNEDSLSIFA